MPVLLEAVDCAGVEDKLVECPKADLSGDTRLACYDTHATRLSLVCRNRTMANTGATDSTIAAVLRSHLDYCV